MLGDVFLPYCNIDSDTKEDRSVEYSEGLLRHVQTLIMYEHACLFVAHCLCMFVFVCPLKESISNQNNFSVNFNACIHTVNSGIVRRLPIRILFLFF